MLIILRENAEVERGGNMLLYHGSNTTVEQPRLLKQTRGLDFGAGFYLTSRIEQAVKFSGNVCRRFNFGTPMVSVYEFDETSAEQKLEILRFTKADELWLDFIKNHRLKTYSGKQYDLIIGPVADDDVLPTILAFVIGQLTAEAAIITLKPRQFPDQYCLASNNALSFLEFKESFQSGRANNG